MNKQIAQGFEQNERVPSFQYYANLMHLGFDVQTALVLSLCVSRQLETECANSYWTLTLNEFSRLTGLSKKTLIRVKKTLLATNFFEERVSGKRRLYRVDLAKLTAALGEKQQPFRETRKIEAAVFEAEFCNGILFLKPPTFGFFGFFDESPPVAKKMSQRKLITNYSLIVGIYLNEGVEDESQQPIDVEEPIDVEFEEKKEKENKKRKRKKRIFCGNAQTAQTAQNGETGKAVDSLAVKQQRGDTASPDASGSNGEFLNSTKIVDKDSSEEDKSGLVQQHEQQLRERQSEQSNASSIAQNCPELKQHSEQASQLVERDHYRTTTIADALGINDIDFAQAATLEDNEKKQGSARNNAASPKAIITTAAPQDIIALVFPCQGKVKEWSISPELYDTLKRCYEHVDIDKEIKKAYAWIVANPDRRKTARGMPRFLNSWIAKHVDQISRGNFFKNTHVQKQHNHCTQHNNDDMDLESQFYPFTELERRNLEATKIFLEMIKRQKQKQQRQQ